MDHLESGMARFGGVLLKLAHWYRRNTRAGSQRNIHAHYDLGNELFQLFLDPTMMYSSAVFPRPDASLEEASLHKLDLVCRKLDLRPDDHLLEIGTGWGGLALHAARNFGCRVTTTTISRNQFDFATGRVRGAGLGDRVKVLARDYRDLTGTFDKLVSIEMIEAVGHRFLDGYFRICSERLKPAGRMLLQAIVIADRNFEQARRSVDFIQKYIFPGGALSSCGALLSSVSRTTDLQLAGFQDIGLDYARTLRIWRERFLGRLRDVQRLGYPDDFVRMWEWYLAYCEGGFRERAISAVQVVFDKPECRLPPPRSTPSCRFHATSLSGSRPGLVLANQSSLESA
jgi:cyclopropane-fatty-acyl-phospholipid synthase